LNDVFDKKIEVGEKGAFKILEQIFYLQIEN